MKHINFREFLEEYLIALDVALELDQLSESLSARIMLDTITSEFELVFADELKEEGKSCGSS